MTDREKVIKGLECCNMPNNHDDCPYNGAAHYNICTHQLLTDAIALLKEQGPIKPTVSVDTWICSKCGHTLESQELIDDKENPQILVHELYDFCPVCGKAVKWDG